MEDITGEVALTETLTNTAVEIYGMCFRGKP